jgi:hypothetical protein
MRTPRERVELDVRNAEPTRKLTRECRLSRAGRTDDRYATQIYELDLGSGPVMSVMT